MIAEDVEFQISQYADGTLSVADRVSVDALLEANPEARQMLAEYRKLDNQLAQLRLPEIEWDQLADHISNSIADSDERAESPAVAGRIGWGALSSRLRIAAAVLITATVGFVSYRSFHHATVSHSVNASVPATVSDVTGPMAEAPTGQASVDISLQPSALAIKEAQSRDVQTAIVPGHPKVIINEAIANPAKDKLRPH